MLMTQTTNLQDTRSKHWQSWKERDQPPVPGEDLSAHSTSAGTTRHSTRTQHHQPKGSVDIYRPSTQQSRMPGIHRCPGTCQDRLSIKQTSANVKEVKSQRAFSLTKNGIKLKISNRQSSNMEINSVLLRNKEEGTIDTCKNLDASLGDYAE